MDEETLLEEIGQRLRAARIKKGDIQKEFGARLGVSRNTVSKMEQGDPAVAIGRWLAAAGHLGVLNTFGKCLEMSVAPLPHLTPKSKRSENGGKG